MLKLAVTCDDTHTHTVTVYFHFKATHKVWRRTVVFSIILFWLYAVKRLWSGWVRHSAVWMMTTWMWWTSVVLFAAVSR